MTKLARLLVLLLVAFAHRSSAGEVEPSPEIKGLEPVAEASIKVLPRDAPTEAMGEPAEKTNGVPGSASVDPEADALFKSLTPEQQDALKKLGKELEEARK